jgi:hypothetical protein
MLRQGEPQLRFLLAEIEKLKQDFPAYLELLRLLEEAAKNAISMRGYLYFSVD